MSELGGIEGFSPEDGISGVPEELSEEARQRFAASASAIQQLRKEERKSKKRDSQVAQVIIQFLSNHSYAHLFVLISKLVARNCPSIFILSIISLVHEESKNEVEIYLQESVPEEIKDFKGSSQSLMKTKELDTETNNQIINWVTRMQIILSLEPENILTRLMIDEKNIDGTVLQLTTFVIQDFFIKSKKTLPFEKVQPLTANILQSVFEPFMSTARKHMLEEKKVNEE